VKLLLDTHTLLWGFAGDRGLSANARAAIGDPLNDVHVSAVSACEIAFKAARGRLRDARVVSDYVGRAGRLQGFVELPLSIAEAERAGRLDRQIRDPFDRLLVSRALEGDLAFVTNERSFER
jgi:PIN domain nuclease of toxin-antitoxin system